MDGDKIELAAYLNARQTVRVSIFTHKVQSMDSVAKRSEDVSAGTAVIGVGGAWIFLQEHPRKSLNKSKNVERGSYQDFPGKGQ